MKKWIYTALLLPWITACPGLQEDGFVATSELGVENEVVIVNLPVESPDPSPSVTPSPSPNPQPNPEPEPEEGANEGDVPPPSPSPSPTPEPEPEPESSPEPSPEPPAPPEEPGVQCDDGRGNLSLLLVSQALGTGLQLNSNAELNAPDGVVVVNRSGAYSVLVESNARLNVGRLVSVGKVSKRNNSHLLGLFERGPLRPDPFGNRAAPGKAGLPVRAEQRVVADGPGWLTLEPGVYRNGIQANSNSKIRLNPGVYYLEQGGILLNSNTQLEGLGVRIVLANGSITLNSNSRLTLTALEDDSPWTRTAVWSRTEADLILNSNTQWSVVGRVYLPNHFLTLNSNSEVGFASQAILNRLRLNSQATVTLDSRDFLPLCP